MSPWVTAATFLPACDHAQNGKISGLARRCPAAAHTAGRHRVDVSVPGVDFRARPALEGIEHLDQVPRLPQHDIRVKRTNLTRGLPGPQQRAAV